MPLIVQEASWWQTPTKVFIKVSLNNVPTGKVDVFTSEKYIKVSYRLRDFRDGELRRLDKENSWLRFN